MSGQIAALEPLQHRAFVEPRRHLVALVEYAFGVAPEMAERLIPHALVEDAERVDCEKPIRDENGQFLGCEPGGGADGNGTGGASKTESTEARWAREKKEDIEAHKQRAKKIGREISVPSGPYADAARKHMADVLNAYEKNDELAETIGFLQRQKDRDPVAEKREDDRFRDNLQEQVAAISRGHVTPLPREKLDRYLEVERPEMEQRAKQARDDVIKDGYDIEQAIADLASVDDSVDRGALTSEITEAASAADTNYQEPDALFHNVDLSDVEPDPESSSDEYNEAVDEYNEVASRREEMKREAAQRGLRVAKQLIAKNEEHVAALKAIEAEHKKIARAVIKEGDVEAADIVTLRDVSDDADVPEDSEEYRQWEEAYSAASNLVEDNSRNELTNFNSKIDEIKTISASAKKIVKYLEKYLAKPRSEPRLEKRPPDQDMDEDDGDEE